MSTIKRKNRPDLTCKPIAIYPISCTIRPVMSTTSTQNDYLTPQEVADELRMTRSWVYKNLSDFEYIECGRAKRITRGSLDAYKARTQGTTQPQQVQP